MIRVVLIFGGLSAEHEVSILSARSVTAAASKQKIEIIPLCMARDGRFVSPARSARVLDGSERAENGDESFSLETWLQSQKPNIAFPLIHGTGGEDGSLQGYLETIGIPYVGSGVAASAIGMDKAFMKHAFAAAKLPIPDFVQVLEREWRSERERIVRAVNNALRLPYFVKPANSGSSVGVTKVKSDDALPPAVEKAFRFDEKVLVERGIDAREIEVSVLGNDSPEASVPGEVVAGREFYDYEDKYIENKAQLIIPAKLAKDKTEEVRRLAVTAFRAIGASGFARVDFFVERGTTRVLVNEINTIPGFTQISMYPKLWEATELKYPRLIERLIELGLERWKARDARRKSAMRWFEEVRSLT
ncbi:MAG TPA: D-alanine--D-alanine ligase family protein [Thermoanaerobaculia bacterium]|nr:D-alanine--D-alanine ligase family protein [Thermoanaerobaculia bacterium]